jgi:LPS-assembly protein
VAAYGDFLRFERWPFAGELWAQPAWFVSELRIVHGAFTTCVQPTRRWEMVAGSVTLKVDDHALMTNALLRVKGVPVMYLPIFYYPVQKDDRATGFLIPVYSTSTIHGQALSNAFFWAISRSQDATFMYDWYSKTGQGYGGEYRYELGAGNRANATFNVLDEHSADYQQSDGSVRSSEASRSFLMRGGLSQALGHGSTRAPTSTTRRTSRCSRSISRTSSRRPTGTGTSAAT